MNTIKKLYAGFLLAGFMLVYSNCAKEEDLPQTPIVDLGGATWTKGDIDYWIDTEFVDPYNIEVKYKWDPYELNYLKDLVPVMENRVEPVMSAVRDIWIKPYETVGGSTFIKTYAPKQFVLAGSAEYNSDNTIVLGQAEGGRKIVLMVVNQFDIKKLSEVQRMLHTIHHEFAHILHQTRMYPEEWKTLNPEWYTATWYNNSDDDANQQGLVTAYAKTNADEDFVETISILLVYGQAFFDGIVNKPAVTASAKAILRSKEAIIVDYFQREYQIDFRLLQQKTQEAISQLAN